jgi:hypothetical protein
MMMMMMTTDEEEEDRHPKEKDDQEKALLEMIQEEEMTIVRMRSDDDEEDRHPEENDDQKVVLLEMFQEAEEIRRDVTTVITTTGTCEAEVHHLHETTDMPTTITVVPKSHHLLETSDTRMTPAPKTTNPRRVTFGNEPAMEVDRSMHAKHFYNPPHTALHFVPNFFHDVAKYHTTAPKTTNPRRVAFGNEPAMEGDARNVCAKHFYNPPHTALHFVPNSFHDVAKHHTHRGECLNKATYEQKSLGMER